VIDEALLRARSEELCRCGHERAWHDACSKCDCPWFVARDNDGAVKRWNADRLKRRRLDPDGKKLPKAEGSI
jgi:hypothetical protein